MRSCNLYTPVVNHYLDETQSGNNPVRLSEKEICYENFRQSIIPKMGIRHPGGLWIGGFRDFHWDHV